MAVLEDKYTSWHEKHEDSSRAFLEGQLNSLAEGRIASNRIVNRVSPPCDAAAYFIKRGYRPHYDFSHRHYLRVIFSDDFGEEYEMMILYDTGLMNGFYLRLLAPPNIPLPF